MALRCRALGARWIVAPVVRRAPSLKTQAAVVYERREAV